MFKKFIRNNSSSIIFILVLFGSWVILYLINSDKTEDYLKSPKVEDVYVFKEQNIYAPMLLDSISEDNYYMRNYLYHFADALPDQDEILLEEFDQSFYAIYEKGEIKRLFDISTLVKIYRN